MGSLYKKKRKGLHIPQRSQILGIEDLLDFLCVISYSNFVDSLEYFNESMQKNVSIYLQQYRTWVPFLVHSPADLNKIENELHESIIKYCRENKSTRKKSLKENHEFASNKEADFYNLRYPIIFLYSYISFVSLRIFIEIYPFYIRPQYFQKLRDGILDSIQFIRTDRRTGYSGNQISESWKRNRDDNTSDSYFLIKPEDALNQYRCIDCKKPIFVNLGANVSRIRCLNCNLHNIGPQGKLERITPSPKHIRKTILPKIENYGNNFLSFPTLFVAIRNQLFLNNEIRKKHYLQCFEKCKNLKLNNLKGPSNYTLAIRHYNPKTKNNDYCYMSDKKELLGISILNKDYRNGILKISKWKEQSLTIEDHPIHDDLVKILLTIKFPIYLIKSKMLKDIEEYSRYLGH